MTTDPWSLLLVNGRIEVMPASATPGSARRASRACCWKRGHDSRARSAARERRARRPDAARVEAGPFAEQTVEAFRQQAGTDEQDDAHRELRDDERAAQPLSAAATAALAAGFADRTRQVSRSSASTGGNPDTTAASTAAPSVYTSAVASSTNSNPTFE